MESPPLPSLPRLYSERMITNITKGYLGVLAKYPITTKTLTATFIAGIADLMAQQIQRKVTDAKLDFKRVARMMIFSWACTHCVHWWYIFLAKSLQLPLHRMLADQLVFAPASLLAFFMVQSLLETGSYSLGIEKMKQSYLSVLGVNYLVWPFICFFNFKYVSPNLQVLVMNVASFFWTIYLSAAFNMPDEPGTLNREQPPITTTASRENRPEATSTDDRLKSGDLRRRKAASKKGTQSTGEVLTEVEEEQDEPAEAIKYASVPHY
jgi:branched-subunit amino acid transport protein